VPRPPRRAVGGIILADTGGPQHQQAAAASVIAVGPGKLVDGKRDPDRPPARRPRVLLAGYSGHGGPRRQLAPSGDDEYVILREEDVIALLD
jgi:co-chaperonin GroES (HSP10)